MTVMMRAIFIFLILGLFTSSLIAQDDPAAISILDKFSERALKASSVTMKFVLLIDDSIEESHMESQGEIAIMNNRYKLTIPENIIWFDGEAIYTLVPDVEEVTITEPDPNDEDFLSSPSLLFTMYRDGYKVRMVGESPEGSIIDLYPEELTADFSRIRLHISKAHDLLEAEYARKDGITMILRVSDFDISKKYKNAFFLFDSKKYGDVDIIDMRF